MKLICSLSRKKISIVLIFCAFFLSCKKDSTPNPTTKTDGYITAAFAQDSHYLRFDSLSYDNSGRIVKIQQSTHDTSGSVPFPVSDSVNYEFTFSGSDMVPSSYKVSSFYYGTANPDELHMLYYDGQNRIVKDSILNGPINTNVSFNYNYGNNLITYNVFANTDTGFVKAETDSLFTDASGNVTSIISYYFDNSGQSPVINYTATYSSYSNPFYDTALSKSLGLFLSQLLSYDFISPKMFSSSTTTSQSSSPDILSYTWTTDAKSRIIKGVEPSGQFGYAFHYSK